MSKFYVPFLGTTSKYLSTILNQIMAPSNVENFSPHIIKQISRELGELTRNPLEGIRIVFNDDDITSVQADIDGPPGTPYHGGSFRLRLVLGKNFPISPPKGFFVTKIFHPNVGRNGEICVNTLKKDWSQDLGIKHILLTIKCLLIAPNPESALNEEAGKMLLEQYDDYCKRAKMMTEIHAPKAKIVENHCQDDCQQQPASSTSSVVSSNNLGNNINGINNNAAMCDKTASSSAKAANKHPHDGVCCSDEPVTKRLNNILDCYNTSTTASDQLNNSPQQQQPQQQPQQPRSNQSSQSSKASQGTSTSATSNARNRGLKRVLRLRS